MLSGSSNGTSVARFVQDNPDSPTIGTRSLRHDAATSETHATTGRIGLFMY